MIQRIVWPTSIPIELRRELDKLVDDLIRNYNDHEARIQALEP